MENVLLYSKLLVGKRTNVNVQQFVFRLLFSFGLGYHRLWQQNAWSAMFVGNVNCLQTGHIIFTLYHLFERGAYFDRIIQYCTSRAVAFITNLMHSKACSTTTFT